MRIYIFFNGVSVLFYMHLSSSCCKLIYSKSFLNWHCPQVLQVSLFIFVWPIRESCALRGDLGYPLLYLGILDMSLMLFVPSFVYSRFPDTFLLLFLLSFCSPADGSMNVVVDPLHGVLASYCLPYGSLLLLSKVLLPPWFASPLVSHYRR